MNLVEIAKEIRETISNKQSQIGLSFEEENHIYTMNGKKDYPSVSKVLKHFYTPFPADEIANRKANGNLEQKQILIKQWEESGNYATNLGSRTHFILEQKSLELFNIEKTANEKYLGVTLLDLGCGLVESRVDPIIFESIFNEIKETPSNKSNLVIEKSILSINNNLTNNVSDVDKKVSQVTLNTKMLELIPTVLTNIIFEPKIVLLYLMSSKIVNGPLIGSDPNIKVTNSFDYSKASKVFFEFITRESLAALLEIIFN
jgi:hypothetical protein